MTPFSLQPHWSFPQAGRGGSCWGRGQCISKHGAKAASACPTVQSPAWHLPCAMPDGGVPGAWPLTLEMFPNKMGRRKTARAASHRQRSWTGALA